MQSTKANMTLAQDIVAFWRAAGPQKWFAKDEAFDAEIRTRFFEAHQQAACNAFAGWIEEAESGLALILLLDQFPRNLYRGSAHAFATDPLALAAAREAFRRGHDARCGVEMKSFFYLPFMHSERIEDQELCLALCRTHGLAGNLSFAEEHRDIIRRFGRFPHRNPVLGRVTTAPEQAYLDGGGFAG